MNSNRRKGSVFCSLVWIDHDFDTAEQKLLLMGIQHHENGFAIIGRKRK